MAPTPPLSDDAAEAILADAAEYLQNGFHEFSSGKLNIVTMVFITMGILALFSAPPLLIISGGILSVGAGIFCLKHGKKDLEQILDIDDNNQPLRAVDYLIQKSQLKERTPEDAAKTIEKLLEKGLRRDDAAKLIEILHSRTKENCFPYPHLSPQAQSLVHTGINLLKQRYVMLYPKTTAFEDIDRPPSRNLFERVLNTVTSTIADKSPLQLHFGFFTLTETSIIALEETLDKIDAKQSKKGSKTTPPPTPDIPQKTAVEQLKERGFSFGPGGGRHT